MVKVAIILGSTGGIGASIVEYFDGQSYNLGLGLLSCSRQHRGSSSSVVAVDGDVRCRDDVQYIFRQTIQEFGHIDVVVFAIGTTSEAMQEAFDVNTLGLQTVLECAGNLDQSIPVIVIGSQRAVEACSKPGKEAYCVSRAAAEMVVKIARKQYPHLRITLIRPGFVNTPLYKEKSLVPYKDGEPYPVTEPSDIVKIIDAILKLSPGAVIQEITLGELLGERGDLEWRRRV